MTPRQEPAALQDFDPLFVRFGSKADKLGLRLTPPNVCLWPKADIRWLFDQLISPTVMPSALAILRFRNSSTFVACWTGVVLPPPDKRTHAVRQDRRLVEIHLVRHGEYLKVIKGLEQVDLTSSDGKELLSILSELDKSCTK